MYHTSTAVRRTIANTQLKVQAFPVSRERNSICMEKIQVG